MHESKLYTHNAFITLTYSDENLKSSSIEKRDSVLFMKKLRKYINEKKPKKEKHIFSSSRRIRSFGCAEYGEKLSRPHFHICLFDIRFTDKKLWKTHNGQSYYTSETLTKIWGKGHVVIGDLTFESAAYVARYVTKKITGKLAEAHYAGRSPEQSVCVSRNPGLGRKHFEKFTTDIYPSDEVIVRGHKTRPPKYYDRLHEKLDKEAHDYIKQKRVENAEKHSSDNTKARSKVRAEILEYKFNILKRSLENGQT